MGIELYTGSDCWDRIQEVFFLQSCSIALDLSWEAVWREQPQGTFYPPRPCRLT